MTITSKVTKVLQIIKR